MRGSECTVQRSNEPKKHCTCHTVQYKPTFVFKPGAIAEELQQQDEGGVLALTQLRARAEAASGACGERERQVVWRPAQLRTSNQLHRDRSHTPPPTHLVDAGRV